LTGFQRGVKLGLDVRCSLSELLRRKVVAEALLWDFSFLGKGI